ncbi:proteasome maturation factor UMP1 [Pseudomassariella vexata]|uniref:Proteasome maturation factor UMP1 n=1 Tax=Pseudomassariella vexata TaxID=1141098 RepID=A0A1Y2DKD5_9PEZI|nr:proteasome maturation factor UMP1 [Pseudomassariella vexata]ORY59693.1 proteasome maturation factor UMP1 [Pseudomassariella vexata]
MSMRIVPAAGNTTSFTHLKKAGAPSAPGLHDTLRHGVGPTSISSDQPTSRHPLESRLKAWEATQEAVRMESLRKTFGMSEPIRRGMELKITAAGEWRPLALGGGLPSVHEDVLRGREAVIEWEDVFTGEEQRSAVGMHDEMERKLKI